MEHYYWNDWYSGWGWFLWFGVIMLIFSSFGNWGYTYRIHRLYGDEAGKQAMDILKERYAGGEITRDDFYRMKSEIKSDDTRDSSPQRFTGKKSPA